MAFNSIPQTWIASGKFTIQSLWQYVKNNFDALYASVFGISNSDVPNGSFEIDSDSDGVPDNWTENLYPGGSAEMDSTDQRSALYSLKFTSAGGAGNGGGYYDSDYVPCSELRPTNLRFAHKSSVAGIHNQVILRWFTSAKVYISATTIYDDAASNPTSWTSYIRGAVPPATACYFKVRLVGANSDNATAGSAWFDEVGLVGGVDTVVGYAEDTQAPSTYGDHLHIETVNASPSVGGAATGSSHALAAARKGVVGGTNVAASIMQGTTVRTTVTLALPEGRWTVWAMAHWIDGDNGAQDYEGNITAMAIREI